MAEATETQTQTPPTSGAGAPASQTSGQAQTSGAPAGAGTGADASSQWSGRFKSADEMFQSYSELEKKLGTQGNELGTYRNAYEQAMGQAQQYQAAVQAWDKWFKDAGLDKRWSDVEKFLKANQTAAGQQQTQQQVADWTANWDTMSPQQQAQALQQVSVREIASALAPSLQQWQQQFTENMQKEISSKEAYFNNYLTLYRRVMDMRMQNPDLDVDKVLDQAVRVLSGQQDPIELGRTLATMETDKETYGKQLLEKARQDWETEQRNKEMTAVRPSIGGTPPAFKMPSAGIKRGDLSQMREGVAKAILDKHGPQAFTG